MAASSPLGALTFSGAGRSLRCVPGPSQCAKASGVWKIWKIWKTRWTKKKTKHHAMVSQRIGPLKAWGKNLRYQGHFCIRWFSGEIYQEIPNILLGFLSRKTRGYHHQSPSQYEEYIPGWWYTYPSEKNESVGMVIPCYSQYMEK